VLLTAALTSAALVGAAYAIGAAPLSWLVARRRGVDLREAGSGNVGATNVWRTTGASAGLLALALDVAKGSAAVLLAQALSAGAAGSTSSALAAAAGVAAVVGHMHPVWLGFRGGKGVATGAGMFLVLAPGALAVAACVFVLTVAVTRYVSLGSTLAAVALVCAAAAGGASTTVVAGAAIVAMLVLARHRGNLTRLAAGTEPRIGVRVAH
jgi:glycerol-3-phosphate acyltransferase PlsY